MSQPAAVMREPGSGVELVDIEVDEPRAGEAEIELLAAGVCGTDLSLRDGRMPFPTPLLLGHEAVGVVRSLGAGPTDETEANDHTVAVGDRVTLWMRPPCRACPACVRGDGGLCERTGFMSARGTLLDGRTSSTLDGDPLYRALGIGAFTTRLVMPIGGLVRVPDDVPDAVAALLGCGVATGAGAILNVARPRPGDVVLVLGAGGVGLAATMAAAAVGAGAVVVADPVSHRREAALDVGATHVIEGGDRKAVRAQLAEVLGSEAPDVAIDAVGRPELVELGFRTVRQGGTVVAVGVASHDATLTLPAAMLTLSHKRIAGCFMGGIDPQRDLPVLFDLHRRGALPVDRLVGATRPLAGVADALDDLSAGRSLRTVITPA